MHTIKFPGLVIDADVTTIYNSPTIIERIRLARAARKVRRGR